MENEEEKSLRLSIVRLTITTERATTTTTTYHNHYGGRKRNDSNDWSIVALSTMIQWKKKEVDCLTVQFKKTLGFPRWMSEKERQLYRKYSYIGLRESALRMRHSMFIEQHPFD